MTAPKNPKDVILVNCQEVPETICVETRFITQSGMQKNIEQSFFSNNGSCEMNKDEQTASALPVQPKTPNFTVSIQPKLVSVGPNTATNTGIQQCQLAQQAKAANSYVQLSNNTTFSGLSTVKDLITTRGIQLNNTSRLPSFTLNQALMGACNIQNASFANTKSIGIQCNIDDEIEDLDVEWPDINKDCSENYEDTENEMQNFLKFVKDNSTQYKNYKECLICGELCKSNKYLFGHMAAHRGPMSLCFKCGQCLEHKQLLPQHNCRKTQQLADAFLKCPHFSCDVTAISRLELYDHINEHTNSRIYKCTACHKGFCTGQEFYRHILIRAKCYTSAKRKRFLLYGLESQKDRQCRIRVFTLHTYKKCTILVKTFLTQRAQKKGFCKICFKTIGNEYHYKSHRFACIAKFKSRLIKKRQK